MNRYRAFAIHLGLSCLVVGLVLATIVFIWYPSPLFSAMSGWAVVKVLIGVDLILGPLLTLLVYKPKKPSLKFDLSVIAAVQIAALCYGTFVFFSERPIYLVHAVDVFHIVTASEIDPSKVQFEELKDIPLVGPKLVVALLPETLEERGKLTEEVMFEGMADIERREEFYFPYEQNLDKVLSRSIDIEEFVDRDPETREIITAFKEKHEDELDTLAYVPLKGKFGFLTLAIDKKTGQPVDHLNVEL